MDAGVGTGGRSGRRRWSVAGAIAAALLAAWVLWPDRRPNVLLITIDSLRPDRVSAYGYTGNRTANLDRLAAEGVLFRNAFCDVPWTTASMASAMTARYAIRHGVRTPYQRLSDGATTLAEVLASHGYQTAAVVGSFPLDHVFNLSQGFQWYDDRYNEAIVRLRVKRERMPSVFYGDVNRDRVFQTRKMQSDSFRTDETVADAAIGWLRRASRRRPFFLWVDFFGPRQKEVAGEPMADALRRYLREYDGDVAGVDAQVGRIVDELDRGGWRRNTLVVVHADHGQSLLAHNYFGHGMQLYDASLRVPLILSLPGRLEQGVVREEMARNIDIMPTVLAIVGAPAPAEMDGRSLAPAIAGTEGGGAPEAFAETLLPAGVFAAIEVPDDGATARIGFRRRALRTAAWKYIVNEPHPLIDIVPVPPLPAGAVLRYRTEELYDLSADPGETRNVIGARPRVAARLRRQLESMVASAAPRRPAAGGAQTGLDARGGAGAGPGGVVP